jgi:hypothetical protein
MEQRGEPKDRENPDVRNLRFNKLFYAVQDFVAGRWMEDVFGHSSKAATMK